MKKFEDVVWTENKENHEKGTIIDALKQRFRTLINGNEKPIDIEDRYELDSCRTLVYEDISEWVIKNKPNNADAAFLVRFHTKENPKYPIMVALMFLEGKNLLLGREYLKKIVYCTFIDEDINKMFDGKESLILK